MRQIIAITHVSLDGVMQAPGGPEEDTSGGFTEGGWTVPYRSDDGGQAILDIVSEPFDLLLGRRTYENFASFWPGYNDNPVGRAFNASTKYVATRTLEALSWATSRRLDGDGVDAVRALKATDGPNLHIWGSSGLLQSLIPGLVDEHRLFVFPVVLGRGKRLFGEGLQPRKLTLVESKSAANGVVFNTYRRNDT